MLNFCKTFSIIKFTFFLWCSSASIVCHGFDLTIVGEIQDDLSSLSEGGGGEFSPLKARGLRCPFVK